MGCAAAASVAIGAIADAIAAISITDVVVGAAVGAAIGGLTDVVEHKPVLPGILEGGITGAVGGAAGDIGGALGGTLGTAAGDILGGAAGGALGGALTGQGAGKGAESGAIGGAIAGIGGALSGAAGASGAGSPTTGGPGASASALAAPAGVSDSTGLPLTAGINPDTGAPVFSPSNIAAATTGPGFGAAPDSGGAVFSPAPAGATAGTAPLTPVTATDVPAAAGATNAAPFVGLQSDTGAGTLGTNPGTGAPVYAPTTDVPGNVGTLGNAAGATAGPAATNLQLSPTTDTTTGAIASGGSSNAYGATGTAPAQSNAFTNQVLGGNIPATGGGGVTVGDSGGGGIGGILGTAGNFISKNPSLALGGALIGYDVLKGNQVPKGENAISATATQLGTQATQLENYLTSGTLPPGVATALQQAASSATAAIRSQYAARGESGSSAEAADLANVQNTIVSQGASIATNLLQQGVNEAGLASRLYGQIMQQSLQSDANLSGALATLAAAAARPTTVTLAGTSS